MKNAAYSWTPPQPLAFAKVLSKRRVILVKRSRCVDKIQAAGYQLDSNADKLSA